MNILHFRVHHKSQEDLEKLINFIISFSSPHIMVLEEASRSHTHTVITIKTKAEQFRRNFKEKFPGYDGNGDFIIQPKDDLQAQYRYVCKGASKEDQPIVLSKLQIPLGDIEKYHEEYWKINAELKPAVKPKTVTTMQEVYNELVKLKKEYTYGLDSDRQIIFKCLMKHLGKAVKILDIKIIERMMNGLQHSLMHREYQKDLYGQLYGESLQ